MRMHVRFVAVSTALFALSGCGGGGGSNNNEAPAPTPTYSVGGSVSGLAGSGLVLTLNGGADLAIGSAGSFSFPAPLASGASYLVAVKTQPTSPHQTCVATNTSGTVSAAVTNISVSCTTNSYSIGGAVGGLSGGGLTLSLNDDVELAIGTSGNFTFPNNLDSGSSYSVEVTTQPTGPAQTCAITNATGTVGGGPVFNVSVACATNRFLVAGSVSGLTGSGLQLRLNGTTSLPVSANGDFSFPAPLASGASYFVTIQSQPVGPYQTCLLTNGSGTVTNGNTNISVNCTTDRYSVGGTVTGLTGSGLVLRLNGSQDLPIAADGAFEFPTELLSGQTYQVTVSSQTSAHRELCAATNASGSGATLDVTTVKVECATVLGFMYVVGANNQLVEYGIRPDTGALLPIGPIATVGSNSREMIASPDGSTLYVSDTPSSTIRAFSVDQSKGTLSPVAAPVATGASGWGADHLAITPTGEFLYATHISAGTIHLLTVDPVTGALTPQGVVATGLMSGLSASHRVAMTPDGAFLYALSYIGASAKLDTFAIDPATGALSPVTSSTPSDIDGMTIDPLGRFLYLRNQLPSANVTRSDTTVYPFTIDAVTGLLTPVVTITVESSGHQMTIDPTGRFAYLLGAFNYVPTDNHIDTFAIDQTTGALTVIGSPVLVSGRPWAGLACDATGRFLFVANQKTTFSPSAPYDASTFPIHGAGPTEGQLSPAGSGGTTEAVNYAIVVIQ
ncbi:lactonase family protein [Peristeroidobacter soli]|jgi:6-phosphogluconolactonase (cycloisomerase 2 family)|uniref:lactonase family protein n=1 Tax=Peristeroidobacter soli TaxID=2497877 RepID=UPI00101CAB87|nr:beta-propeller fold lactonase family protein [Peristeroidobacter soli]